MSLMRSDSPTSSTADIGGGGSGACKLTSVSDELQDGGDNSLEPGEVVTPPHQGSASPALLKKSLAKDVMSKALRKLTQIDTIDTCEEKARALLELESIRRKEVKTTARPLENGATAAAAAPDDNDDSEGLYSDTDSSADEQKNVEDVQQARKEKQAEAAAATQPPAPHPFLSLSPLRFHMRPPCYDFPRLGFMPRMARGGMRGMRPPLYFNRPPAPLNPIQTERVNPLAGKTPPPSPGAYGPALPPSSGSKSAMPAASSQALKSGRSKRQQSEPAWTQAQPPLAYIFNLVSECANKQHKTCRPKSEPAAASKKSAKSKETAGESRRERDRDRDRSKERRRRQSREPEKSSRKSSRKSKSKSSSHKSQRSSAANEEELRLTPPVAAELAKDSRKAFDIFAESPPRLNTQTPIITTTTTPKKPPPPLPEAAAETHSPAVGVGAGEAARSTTPPLPSSFGGGGAAVKVEAKTAPLLKASEIHSRIDALLQDNDLHLEALLATKEQLLRKTNEHRGKTKTPAKTAEKEKEKEATKAVPDKQPQEHSQDVNKDKPDAAVRIKLEPMEPRTSSRPARRSDPRLEKEKERRERQPEQLSAPSSELPSSRPANPFKRESAAAAGAATAVLKDNSHSRERLRNSSRHVDRSRSRDASRDRRSDRHASSRSRERGRSIYRNGSRENPIRRRERSRSIKVERNRSKTPPTQPLKVQIKVERDATPPLPAKILRLTPPPLLPPLSAAQRALGHVNGKEQPSPDTDDYIDNWENDDSMAGDSSTPKTQRPHLRLNANPTALVSLSVTVNGAAEEEEEDDTASYSNKLWNAKSTPPPKVREQLEMLPLQLPLPKAKSPTSTTTTNQATAKALINIHELYDRFMNSIKMGQADAAATTAATAATATATSASDVSQSEAAGKAEANSSSEVSKNSSLSNSTAEDTSSSTESTSSSSSSSDEDEDEEEEEDDENEDESSTDEAASTDEEQTLTIELPAKASVSDLVGRAASNRTENHKKNNVSKDLRKLKSLEENLARIQMMRENYDSGDDICEELLKMESLFLMQKNAIMDKYRKHDLKLAEQKKSENDATAGLVLQVQEQQQQQPSPVNNIFDANREAIKLTISPLKLTRKSAIFDKDAEDVEPQSQPPPPQRQSKPAKEIAIVKPTIVDTKRTGKRGASSPSRRRTRDRSPLRGQPRRNSLRSSRSRQRGSGDSRSTSPRRWRQSSPRFGARPRFGKRRSSRSPSRSRTRSRSPQQQQQRRRRSKFNAGRRRNSLSPRKSPHKPLMGPRSPPPPARRRSYSRERYSRSPLPFKPPSPPMRRSWSSSRSPTRRRSRSRSPFADYFEENHSMDAATAYYYNMSLLHGAGGAVDATGGDPNGEHYNYAAYAAYMDTAYNMSSEDAYAQYMEYSNVGPAMAPDGPPNLYSDYGMTALPVMESSGCGPMAPVLRELPKAPAVAVQKGNVLEIVPSHELTIAPAAAPTPAQEQPKEQPPVALAQQRPEESSKPKRKRVNFVDHVQPNNDSEDEDRKLVQQAVERAIKKTRDPRSVPPPVAPPPPPQQPRSREELLALPAPPPPATPKPAPAQPLRKQSKFRFYHFDPFKRMIVRTPTRNLRPPRFDPKYMAMLMKSGRLPMPPFAFHALRHRPPLLPPHAKSARAALMVPSHPPPPVGHLMGAGARATRPPFPGPHYMHLRPPPPFLAAMPPQPQPIPVVGQSYGCSYPPHPATVTTSTPPPPLPMPMPLPLQLPLAMPMPVDAMPRSPYGVAVPPPLHFTPPLLALPLPLPPLQPLQPSFSISSIPNIKEIMPVDILQKIGPLPKTLDLDCTSGMDEVVEGTDLKESQADAVLLEMDANSETSPIVATKVDSVCQQQLVETQ